eukprot:g11587.t1
MTSHQQQQLAEVIDTAPLAALEQEQQQDQQQQAPGQGLKLQPQESKGPTPLLHKSTAAAASPPREQQSSLDNISANRKDIKRNGGNTNKSNANPDVGEGEASSHEAPAVDVPPARQDAGEIKDLLERVGEVMERRSLNQDHRGAEHLALAPEALERLRKALPLLSDKKVYGKTTLLAVFQKCEEAVLAATDDGGGDVGGSRKTLELAKEVVEGMLAHPRLEEVRTSGCRARLERYIRELNGFLQALALPLQPHSGSTQSSEGKEGTLLLRDSGWGQEERAAMKQFCEERFMALQPHVSDLERVEKMRQYAEMALRQRFREGRVLVFGSAASTLSVPESDIDLTLHLPSRVKLVQDLKDLVESKREETMQIEERNAEAVQLLLQQASVQKKLSRLRGAVRDRKNSLADMRRARDRIAERLDALKAAEIEREKHALAHESTEINAPAKVDDSSASPDPPVASAPAPPSTATTPAPSASSQPSTSAVDGSASAATGVPSSSSSSAEKPASKINPAGKGDGEGDKSTDDGGSESLGKGDPDTCEPIEITVDPQGTEGEEENEGGTGEKGKEQKAAGRKGKGQDEVEVLAKRLRASESAIRAGEREQAEIVADCEEAARAFGRSTRLEDVTPEQKKQVQAVRACRNSLKQAQQELQATGKIVLEMKYVLQRHGFTDVWAVHKCRVPVVKTTAPQRLWGPTGQPCRVDVSVNNLIAVHNTRLLKAYADLDPRCHRLLYIVKNWSKARGVNDSSKGTLSSYAHCITALHYLTRIGVVPCLLKEHPSLSKGEGGEGGESSPTSPPKACLVEGIDVSFSNAKPALLLQQQQQHQTSGRTSNGSADSGVTEGEGWPKTGRALAVENAEVSDLLLGYFEYVAEGFCHATRVMSLRPKSLLNKASSWNRPKLWRTSVEDPFMTFDSASPHDLGWVLTRPGQALLHDEWKRGHAILRKGGPVAMQELLAPSDKATKSSPSQDGDRGARGGGGRGRGRGGGRGGANGRSDIARLGRGGGRGGTRGLRSPADGTGRRHLGGGAVAVLPRPHMTTPHPGQHAPTQQHQHQHQQQQGGRGGRQRQRKRQPARGGRGAPQQDGRIPDGGRGGRDQGGPDISAHQDTGAPHHRQDEDADASNTHVDMEHPRDHQEGEGTAGSDGIGAQDQIAEEHHQAANQVHEVAAAAATRGPGIVQLNFMGRLGNNLFEYAAARALADRLGWALSIQPAKVNVKKFGLSTRPEGMSCFPGVRPLGPPPTSREMAGLETVKFRGVRQELEDPVPRSIEMQGWFQDYGMFKSEKDRLRKIMALSPSCCGPTAPGPNDLVIHHRNYKAELTEQQYEKLIFKDLKYEFYQAVLRDAADSAAGRPKTV